VTTSAPAGRLRLLPDELEKVPRAGAVGSLQAGELVVGQPVSRVLGREFLDWAAAGYWRFVARVTLGLIRVGYAGDHQAVVLVRRPLVLLRFRAPEYELAERGGAVTWRIERGLLVSREGRNRGFLRLTVAQLDREPSGVHAPVRVQMEVRNFYPWLRGSGRFARFGAWLYGHTQQRVHRWIARGFLRAMAGDRCYI
jgi:hypothetical protein